jgi:6-phosphogluconate dehydrogenase (decarboxylating)
MIGLGRMGNNMAQRLQLGRHRVVDFDPAEAARSTLEKSGGESACRIPARGAGRWRMPSNWVSAPVITLSLLERLRSRDDDSFTDTLFAAMRNQFGGHEIKKE